MVGKRLLLMLFAASILLLNSGECISVLFADPQATNCCTRGHCAPTDKLDPCCESSFLSVTKYFQTEGRFSFSQGPFLISVALADALHSDLFRFSSFHPLADFTFHSPPWASKKASLPLLI